MTRVCRCLPRDNRQSAEEADLVLVQNKGV